MCDQPLERPHGRGQTYADGAGDDFVWHLTSPALPTAARRMTHVIQTLWQSLSKHLRHSGELYARVSLIGHVLNGVNDQPAHGR